LVGYPIIKYIYTKLITNKNPFQNKDVCKW
jgi:hypothetical protein